MQQRLGGESQLLDHDIERARLAAMAPEHVLDVERRGVESLRHGRDLGGRHEQERGPRVDEPPDQPWAGNPVDLRPRACDPDRAAAAVAGRQFAHRNKRKLCLAPALEPIGQSTSAGTPSCRSQAAAPSLSFWPR